MVKDKSKLKITKIIFVSLKVAAIIAVAIVCLLFTFSCSDPLLVSNTQSKASLYLDEMTDNTTVFDKSETLINNETIRDYDASTVSLEETLYSSYYDNSLSEDEREIADALTFFLYQLINMEYQEHPAVYSFLNTNVKVLFVNGYIWRWGDIPNTRLIEYAHDGITCFLDVPNNTIGYPLYFIFCLGIQTDGTYCLDTCTFYTEYRSIEEFFEYRDEYHPLDEYIHTFSFHFAQRDDSAT